VKESAPIHLPTLIPSHSHTQKERPQNEVHGNTAFANTLQTTAATIHYTASLHCGAQQRRVTSPSHGTRS